MATFDTGQKWPVRLSTTLPNLSVSWFRSKTNCLMTGLAFQHIQEIITEGSSFNLRSTLLKTLNSKFNIIPRDWICT